MSYVGTCDASGDGDNVVSLVLESLWTVAAPIDPADWTNPCGDPGDAATWDGSARARGASPAARTPTSGWP